MPSTLSPEAVLHLARLSRLELTLEEQERFAAQLSLVVAYVDQLSAADTSKSGTSYGVTGLTNVLADDLPHPEGDLCVANKENWLAAAPARDGDFIQVRAVLGDEVAAA